MQSAIIFSQGRCPECTTCMHLHAHATAETRHNNVTRENTLEPLLCCPSCSPSSLNVPSAFVASRAAATTLRPDASSCTAQEHLNAKQMHGHAPAAY